MRASKTLAGLFAAGLGGGCGRDDEHILGTVAVLGDEGEPLP